MSLYINGQLEAGINQVPSYTQAEYDALEIKPEFWICTDRNYSSVPAANITYDNTDSGLSATDVQDAIDELEDNKSNKSDLTSIFQTGTTASQAIVYGAYFYLDNVLVRAKADIANGGTFTENTNYEVVTAGALNEIAIRTQHVYYEGNNQFIVVYRVGRIRTLQIWNTPSSIVNTITLLAEDVPAAFNSNVPIPYRETGLTILNITGGLAIPTTVSGNIHGSVTYIH